MKLLDVDLRIVMTWDADMTDMDLCVIEPSNEKHITQIREARSVGLVSREFYPGIWS